MDPVSYDVHTKTVLGGIRLNAACRNQSAVENERICDSDPGRVLAEQHGDWIYMYMGEESLFRRRRQCLTWTTCASLVCVVCCTSFFYGAPSGQCAPAPSLLPHHHEAVGLGSCFIFCRPRF